MSSGSRTTFFDDYNQSSKNWIGGNGRGNENPYTLTYFRYASTKSHGQHLIYPFDTYDAYVRAPELVGTTLPVVTNEVVKAQAKLADAVRGHSFNANVTLGEAHQTVDLIVQNTKKVLGAARALRRGDFQKATRMLLGSGTSKRPKSLSPTDLANFWIELQYGWKPLLSEISEAQKAYKAHREQQKLTFHAREKNRIALQVNSYGDIGYKTVEVNIKASFYDTLSLAQSVGIISPLSVNWEILPWSFVIDWFIPIGTFLDNYSFFSGLACLVTTTQFRVVGCDYDVPNFMQGPNWNYTGGSWDWIRIAMDRSVSTGMPLAVPTFKTMQQALSLGHLSNAAALITQQISATRKAFR